MVCCEQLQRQRLPCCPTCPKREKTEEAVWDTRVFAVFRRMLLFFCALLFFFFIGRNKIGDKRKPGNELIYKTHIWKIK
jgi:hypothetical protein